MGARVAAWHIRRNPSVAARCCTGRSAVRVVGAVRSSWWWMDKRLQPAPMRNSDSTARLPRARLSLARGFHGRMRHEQSLSRQQDVLTVRWILLEWLGRRSLLLACMQATGSHTAPTRASAVRVRAVRDCIHSTTRGRQVLLGRMSAACIPAARYR